MLVCRDSQEYCLPLHTYADTLPDHWRWVRHASHLSTRGRERSLDGDQQSDEVEDEWFWKAQRLVDPTANLSVRQAFVLLTGGFTTGAGDQDLPALQSFGGFRPFQLRTIYASLDSGLREDTIAANRSLNEAPRQNTEHVDVENIEERRPLFRKDVSYCRSMLEREDHLVPVVRVLQDIEGVPLTRLALPLAALPLLERCDGTRSVRAIIDEVIALSAEDTHHRVNGEENGAVHHEHLLAVARELYKQRVVEAV